VLLNAIALLYVSEGGIVVVQCFLKPFFVLEKAMTSCLPTAMAPLKFPHSYNPSNLCCKTSQQEVLRHLYSSTLIFSQAEDLDMFNLQLSYRLCVD
jgi:hypothetical protein